jgi:hypothetical protein
MSHTAILTRAEIESMGPPLPMEIADTGISEQFLCDLALKHVAMLHQPSTHADRGPAAKPVSREADRSEDAIGNWFHTLRDVGPRLGPSNATIVGVRLCWTGAGLPPGLHTHDEAPIDSV